MPVHSRNAYDTVPLVVLVDIRKDRIGYFKGKTKNERDTILDLAFVVIIRKLKSDTGVTVKLHLNK